MTPLLAAYVVLFSVTGAIGAISRRIAPKNAQPSPPQERRSSMVLGVAHTASMLAGFVFPWLRIGNLGFADRIAWAAVSMMLLAFAFQVWAMLTLGSLFTLTLEADSAQPVVERGPYRLVRHPGYLAQIVLWLAFAVACRNAIVLAVVVAVDAIAYGLRIRTEERMLKDALGERYERYAGHRARLVPGVW